MCSFTNISLKKMLDFFAKVQNYRMNHIFQDILLKPRFFFLIIETRFQNSKNAPKWTKNGKIHDVDKSTLVFGFQ